MDGAVREGVEGASAGSRHHLLNPETLAPPSGFSHAVVPAAGPTVYLAGQAGHRADGSLAGTVVEQFDQACANVVQALRAAGGEPEDVVSMQILVTDAGDYRAHRKEIGEAYRGHFGRHFPAMTLMEVGGLFDPEARVELTCIAVIPSESR